MGRRWNPSDRTVSRTYWTPTGRWPNTKRDRGRAVLPVHLKIASIIECVPNISRTCSPASACGVNIVCPERIHNGKSFARISRPVCAWFNAMCISVACVCVLFTTTVSIRKIKFMHTTRYVGSGRRSCGAAQESQQPRTWRDNRSRRSENPRKYFDNVSPLPPAAATTAGRAVKTTYILKTRVVRTKRRLWFGDDPVARLIWSLLLLLLLTWCYVIRSSVILAINANFMYCTGGVKTEKLTSSN